MIEQTIVYKSPLSIKDCLDRITESPQQYFCEYGTPLCYETQFISLTQGMITFKGGMFRRSVRSQYKINIAVGKGCTYFILRFHKEMFGVSSMTPISDIDLCMAQKLNAARIVYEYEGNPFPLWKK